MAGRTPSETVQQLLAALSKGDLEAAVALYEPDAVMLAEPGKPARGKAAIRAALAGFIALKPTVISEADQTIEGNGVALYCSKWSLNGTSPDGKPIRMHATSTDILRRQADGTWLIAVDNPWGTAVLG